MEKNNFKQTIKFIGIILVVAIIIAIAVFKVIKYEVEGEKNMPFQLGKIIVISSATINSAEENNTAQTAEDGTVKEENAEQQIEKFIWNENVIQTNDVYVYIDKNENNKEEQLIKNVKIENIQFLKNVNIGKIQVYMPSSVEGVLYKYINDYVVNSTLTYRGAEKDDKKNLEIGNQGGCVYFSFANVGLPTYKSNEDTEIAQGAFILEKMGLNEDDLKFKVAFDLIIEVKDKSYKGTVTLDLPVNNVVGVKETHTEITDFSNVIFKR